MITKEMVQTSLAGLQGYSYHIQVQLTELIWALLNKNENKNTIRVLDTLYCKPHADLITIDGHKFIIKVLSTVNQLIIEHMDMPSKVITVLRDDFISIINTICRDGVIPIELPLHPTHYYLLRKLITDTFTTNELQSLEMDSFKSLTSKYLEWMMTNRREVRKHINGLRATTHSRALAIIDTETYRETVVSEIINFIKENEVSIPDDIMDVLKITLSFTTFWMVIPDDVLQLKSRRLLGRYINRLRKLKETECQ